MADQQETASFHVDHPLCDACGQPRRAVPTEHRDGSVTLSYECHNAECSMGHGGLMTVRQVRKNTGDIVAHTKFWDLETFREFSSGRPSQNEENVRAVAEAFIKAANSQFEKCYAGYKIVPPVRAHKDKYDCIAVSTVHDSLKLQITRALPSRHYENQARLGRRDFLGKNVRLCKVDYPCCGEESHSFCIGHRLGHRWS